MPPIMTPHLAVSTPSYLKKQPVGVTKEENAISESVQYLLGCVPGFISRNMRCGVQIHIQRDPTVFSILPEKIWPRASQQALSC